LAALRDATALLPPVSRFHAALPEVAGMSLNGSWIMFMKA
jgi:hypothetical protein